MKKLTKIFKKFDWLCLLPVSYLLLTNISYLGQSPVLDAMVIYRESTVFFYEGFAGLPQFNVTFHPPLIYLVNCLAFLIFGKSPLSVQLMGILILMVTSISFYFFLKRLFSRKVALIACILLFCNPIVMVHTFFITNDVLILCGFIFATIFYTHRRYLALAFILGLMVLMKETALVFVAGIILLNGLELLLRIKHSGAKGLMALPRLLFIIIVPVGVYLVLNHIKITYGLTEWQENMIVKTEGSSYNLVLNNILTLQIFNSFLVDNLINLLIFNWQWVYALSIPILLITNKKRSYFKNKLQLRFVNTAIILGVLFILLSLSFQTFTVIRYGIPALMPIMIILTLAISRSKFQLPVLIVIGMVMLVSNFTSIDPVTRLLNPGMQKLFHIEFYNNDFFWNGPDRVIYNHQHLDTIVKHNQLVSNFLATDGEVLISYCDEYKVGEKFWSISLYNEFYPQFKVDRKINCINDFNIEKELHLIGDRKIYVDSNFPLLAIPKLNELEMDYEILITAY